MRQSKAVFAVFMRLRRQKMQK